MTPLPGVNFLRAARFVRQPWAQTAIRLRARFKSVWNRLCPHLPLPVRLPYGGWWLARADDCSDEVFLGRFERNEMRFVGSFLKEGMIILDIGAHNGFYTMLAAKKVSTAGSVIAFEPSPRERRRLLLHRKVNGCDNVTVEALAISNHTGKATLFVVKGRHTGFNSLRPPAVSEPLQAIDVCTITLDTYLKDKGVRHVDFIKMDVEGGELGVLQGAERTLCDDPRPLIMLEIQDIRTDPWGYAAVAIHDYLIERNYRCFSIGEDGSLITCPRMEHYDVNAVAVPQERMNEVRELIRCSPDLE
jgi:FkbM family methyltransferase